MTFEPGARTAWHTHPMGQTLVVTAGVGRVQRWGDPVQQIQAGDVVWIPPGQKHWHGAAPTTAMTHIAITELWEGKAVDWLEQNLFLRRGHSVYLMDQPRRGKAGRSTEAASDTGAR